MKTFLYKLFYIGINKNINDNSLSLNRGVNRNFSEPPSENYCFFFCFLVVVVVRIKPLWSCILLMLTLK